MIAVGIAEAKAQLSKLVDAAAAGDEIVITRKGVAVARLVPIPAIRGPASGAVDQILATSGGDPKWVEAPVVDKPKPAPAHQRPGLTMADMVKLSRG